MTNGLLVGRPHLVLSVAAAVGLLVAFAEPVSSRAVWVGYLPTTASAVESTVLWLPSVLGGVAAWLVGQHRAHGLDEWADASPRDRRSRRLPTLVAVLLVGMSVHVTVFAVVVIDSLRHGMLDGADSPWMVIAAPTTIAVTACWCALGTWMGSTWRREAAIPLAVLAPYAAYVCFLLAADSPLAGLAVADGRNFSYVRPSPEMWTARLAFWTLLAVTLVVRVVRGPTPLFRLGSWATSLAAASALLYGASFTPASAATTAVCEGSTPRVCVEYAFRTVMPRYESSVAELWRQLPAPVRPVLVTSGPSLGLDDWQTEGLAVVAPPVHGFDEPSRLIDPTMFAARFGDAVFVQQCAGLVPISTMSVVIWWRTNSAVPIDRPAYISDWLYPADPKFGPAQAAATALAALNKHSREAWFTRHAADLTTCASFDVSE